MLNLKIYGIRHHGPGSARNLLAALQAQQPDVLLLEHPADTQAALKQATTPGLTPPVALLVYNPKDFQQAAYYPFAAFSPEWVALQYAAQCGIPVEAVDLPAGLQFKLTVSDTLDFSDTSDPAQAEWYKDPIGQIAALAGYADSEGWWDALLERQATGSGVFEAVEEMVMVLRESAPFPPSAETLLREAHMRLRIHEATEKGYTNMAVVCGAWHAPALRQGVSAQDRKLLKGRKSVKTKAVWIPWTYERLAFGSGYRAGVISPAWYALLFEYAGQSAQQWMARVAQLMRAEDWDTSTAHVVEAIRLAQALAALRRHETPGVEELEEAALTVFFQGDVQWLNLVRRRLIIGEAMGAVPASLPVVPLVHDLEQDIRRLRLSKEYQSLGEVLKHLDLRIDSHRQISSLLYRLLLLDVPWGTRLNQPDTVLSTFRESWRLRWLPDYTMRLVQAGVWGNTVADAARQRTLDQCRRSDQLPELAALTMQVLHAALPEVIPALLQKLAELAAPARDIHLLMAALPSLVHIVRYGNVRQTDTSAVRHLVQQFVPRIALGFPAACLQLDEEPAQDLFHKMWNTQHHIALLNDPELMTTWQQALAGVIQAEGAHPLLKGGATRICFDRQVFGTEEASRYFALALSPGFDPAFSSRWVEGFLHGSGLLLIHHPPLWHLLDNWVSSLPEAAFRQALPLLRRAFSAFSGPERQKMLALAAKAPDAGYSETAMPEIVLNEERLSIIAPMLTLLLDTPVETVGTHADTLHSAQ